jgi:hypothetical protein
VAFRAVGGVLLVTATMMGAMAGDDADVLAARSPSSSRTRSVACSASPRRCGSATCRPVQPIMGFIPLLTMAGGVFFLHEEPSALAMFGILLVVLGLYFVGLRKGGSALEPIRAFATSRASWIALLATLFWTVTSLTHKIGIAEVGAMPWATALTLGSAGRTRGRSAGHGQDKGRTRSARRDDAVAAADRALRRVLRRAAVRAAQRAPTSQAGYVMAVVSSSILLATTVGCWCCASRAARTESREGCW